MPSDITVSDLREFIREFVDASPDANNTPRWWRAPLLVTAAIDERFDMLPKIAAKDHLLPADLLPAARSIIVYFLPFTQSLVKENSRGKFPVRNWAPGLQRHQRTHRAHQPRARSAAGPARLPFRRHAAHGQFRQGQPHEPVVPTSTWDTFQGWAASGSTPSSLRPKGAPGGWGAWSPKRRWATTR